MWKLWLARQSACYLTQKKKKVAGYYKKGKPKGSKLFFNISMRINICLIVIDFNIQDAYGYHIISYTYTYGTQF